MKNVKRVLSGMLAVLMLCVALVPMRAQAAGLPVGSSFKLPKRETVYTVNVSADSLLNVSWSGNSSGYASFRVYYDSAATKSVKSILMSNAASGSDGIALSKGTYYITTGDYRETTSINVKLTPVSKLNKSNYTRKKAISLKANKNVQVAQTPMQDYTRWYKIKLKKNKKITLTTNKNGSDYINIYTSNMNKVKMGTATNNYTRIQTADTLAKGTYYIQVKSADYYYSTYPKSGPYIRFKWQ